MTVSVVSDSSASGSTSVAVPYPSGALSGDLLVLAVSNKYPTNGPSTPSGWTLRKQQSGGTGSAGVDSGSVYCTVFTKTATGSESGSLTVTITSGDTAVAMMAVVRSSSDTGWGIDVVGGSDNSAGTSWSVTTGALDVQQYDMVLAFSALNTRFSSQDFDWESESTAMSGVTFGPVVDEMWTGTTTGDDCALHFTYQTVTAGSASAAATYTATSSTSTANSPAGATVLLRLRDAGPDSGTPDAKVEVGFGSDPFDDTPTFTDISEYVDTSAGITIQRGRQDADSQVQPGTCAFRLRNSDGRFTPGNTSGPYGSDVKLRVKMKVSLTYNGTSYDRFTGYVQSWRLAWPGGVEESAVVEVVLVDLLGILADTSLRHSHAEAIMRTDPVGLWPMTEQHFPLHDVADFDQPPMRKLNRGGGSGTCHPGADRGRFPSRTDMDTCFIKAGHLNSAGDKQPWSGAAVDVDYQSASTYIAFGGWVRYDADAPTVRAYIASLELTSLYSIVLWYDPDYGLTCGIGADRAASPTYSQLKGRIGDGRWHHVVVRYEKSSYELELFVDGESCGTGATGLSAPFGTIVASGRFVVGGADYPATLPSYTAMQRGWLSHWAVWTDADASGLDIDMIVDDGKHDVPSSSRSSAQLDWLLDWVGFPTAHRNIEVGCVSVPRASVSRSSAFDYANSLASTELGVFFADRSGYGVFHARPHRYTYTADATLDWHDPAEAFTTDVDSLINIAEANYTRNGGGTVRMSRPSSRTAFGRHRQSVGGEYADANFARGAAELLLDLRATPNPRISTFTWDLLTSDSVTDNEAALGLEIGSGLTLDSLPSPAHTSSVDLWCEGFTERIAADEWSITANTSPFVDVLPDGHWVLGTSVLDTDTILGY